MFRFRWAGSSIQRIRHLWERYTVPLDKVTDSVRRERSKLLASLLLLMTLFILFVLPFRYLFLGDSSGFGLRVLIALTSALFVYFNYHLARRGYYEIAGITVYMLSILSILLSSALVATAGITTVYYLIIPTLFVGLFFTIRATLWSLAVQTIGMVILSQAVPHVDMADIIQGPMVFLVLMTGIILVFAVYRERLENIRQTELKRTQERYRALFVGAQDAILIKDATGIIMDANPAAVRLFGYEQEQLVRMNIIDLYQMETDKESVRDPDSTAPIERIALHRNGRLIPIEMTHASLDSDDRTYHLSIIRDVSVRTRVEQQRLDLAVERERVALLEGVISDLNHDLMTPISIIKTGVYLLRRTNSAERRAQRLDQIDEQLRRLQSMIEDVLTLSRLDRDAAGGFHFVWADLNKMVARVVEDYRDFARDRSRQLIFKPDMTLPPVAFDDPRLRLALANLLKNGLTYTHEGDTVIVSTGYNEIEGLRHLYIEVQDTGPGIDPDQLPYILDPFYRGEKHRPLDMGAGLGLSIAQKIAEGHGGSIEVESVLQQGSTFRILLPVLRHNDQQPAH